MAKSVTLEGASAIKIISSVQTVHILYKNLFQLCTCQNTVLLLFRMDCPKLKRQHVDRTLKEKLEILKHLGSMKGIDICRKYGIKQSTLSTWKKQKAKLQEMVEEGKVLDTKRNHASLLPKVERALHIWFCEMRSKPHAPPLNREVLAQKAT